MSSNKLSATQIIKGGHNKHNERNEWLVVGYIYIISCIATDKIYIGSTKDINSRWKQHKAKKGDCSSITLFNMGNCNITIHSTYYNLTKRKLEYYEYELIRKNKAIVVNTKFVDYSKFTKGFNIDVNGEIKKYSPFTRFQYKVIGIEDVYLGWGRGVILESSTDRDVNGDDREITEITIYKDDKKNLEYFELEQGDYKTIIYSNGDYKIKKSNDAEMPWGPRWENTDDSDEEDDDNGLENILNDDLKTDINNKAILEDELFILDADNMRRINIMRQNLFGPFQSSIYDEDREERTLEENIIVMRHKNRDIKTIMGDGRPDDPFKPLYYFKHLSIDV